MADGPIRTRASFETVLAETIGEAARREAAEPAYPTWGLIRRHLERMQELTSGGATPGRAERDKCLPGTIVMRELEPAHDPDIYNFCQRCHELQYYFQEKMRSSWWKLWD